MSAKTLIGLGVVIALEATSATAQSPLTLEFSGAITILAVGNAPVALVPGDHALDNHPKALHVASLYFHGDSFDVVGTPNGFLCTYASPSTPEVTCELKITRSIVLSFSNTAAGPLNVDRKYLADLPSLVSNTPLNDALAGAVPPRFRARILLPKGDLAGKCDDDVREWDFSGNKTLLTHTAVLKTTRLMKGDDVLTIAGGGAALTLKLKSGREPVVGFQNVAALGPSMSMSDHHFLLHYLTLMKPASNGSLPCKSGATPIKCPLPTMTGSRGCPIPRTPTPAPETAESETPKREIGSGVAASIRGSNCPPGVY